MERVLEQLYVRAVLDPNSDLEHAGVVTGQLGSRADQDPFQGTCFLSTAGQQVLQSLLEYD